MTIELTDLETFKTVLETQNFTTAAKRLFKTQSAVSQQIKKLETEIGKTLLTRSPKITPTKPGTVLLEYAETILREHQRLITHFKTPDLTGNVNFGLPEDFASRYLEEILVEYSRLHPQVNLHIECDLSLKLYEGFKAGVFDLILVKMSSPKDLPTSHQIMSEELVWVGNQKLADNDGPIPLVVAPSPCVYRARLISSLSLKQIPWRITFSSHSYASTIAAVTAEMGLTVLPKTMTPKSLPIIKNHPKLPQLPPTHISLMKQKTNIPAVNSFEEFIIQKLRS